MSYIREKVDELVEEINAEFDADLEVEAGEEGEIAVNWPGHGHIYIGPLDGNILPKTKLSGGLVDKLREALAPKPAIKTYPNMNGSAAPETRRAIVPRDVPVRDVQVADLSMEDIKGYICPAATDQEAFMFLKLCQARNLNPFTNEAYLIKFGGKAQMVVGKEAFMRKAEMHPQYKGFKAGIIIDDEVHGLTYREGAFLREGEHLQGGWAEVYRKDREYPIRAEVALKDYDSGKDGPWRTHKATMIRKVPLVQAMREAFPSDLSGCYDSSEFQDAIDIEGGVVEG
jgi:phage recombination protein Bet